MFRIYSTNFQFKLQKNIISSESESLHAEPWSVLDRHQLSISNVKLIDIMNGQVWMINDLNRKILY